MPASEFPERINTLAQPIVLSTLQKLIRALEVVEGAEEDAAQRAGVIKAKSIAKLFANIWGASFEEEEIAGLLLRKWAEPAAATLATPPRDPATKGTPKLGKLLRAIGKMNGREFTSRELCAATMLDYGYVSTACSKLRGMGKLRRVGARPGRGHDLTVYRAVGGGKDAVL